MSRPTTLSIDVSAMQHNLRQVRSFAPNRSIIAMVKANAYGHGIVTAAKAFCDANALGVASLEEGMHLREAGIQQPIVLMEGVFSQEELPLAERHGFTLVVHHVPHIEMLEHYQAASPFPIWLKVNTGMHRLGFEPSVLPNVYERLNRLSAIQKPIGIMTHFAEADLVGHAATSEQLSLFRQVAGHYPGPKSMANSAGILAWPDSHGDWVRPGLMLYGASPLPDRMGSDFQLKPAMTLWSRIIAITQVKKGGKVGYGGTWTAPEDMMVGVVGVGYGDGYPQFAENGTPVLVNGVMCSLVGRVSMDMLTVDLRKAPHAKVSDEVVLWGQGLPVERVAKACHTSPYELLTRMTPRPKINLI